jgi:hypothetical protein
VLKQPSTASWHIFTVREKELRVALVCFGGISLAVYIHGVSKEILKLVRASTALHDIRDRAARACATFAELPQARHRHYDTEAIYFELLREIGRNIDLRVIVDIIAGASAGGINGTMLARALAHDLPMDGCATGAAIERHPRPIRHSLTVPVKVRGTQAGRRTFVTLALSDAGRPVSDRAF